MSSNGRLRPWQVDKAWSDGLLTQIKRELGPYVLVEAPQVEDLKRGTDLMEVTLTLSTGLRVACRVRRGEQLRRDLSWGGEFTLRSSRPSGVRTELTKIIEGYGTHFFYGFAEEELLCWFLGDLNVFRLWFARCSCRRQGIPPGKEIENADGTRFRVFALDELPAEFLIGRQLPPSGLRWRGGDVEMHLIDLEPAPPAAQQQEPAARTIQASFLSSLGIGVERRTP